MRLGIDASNLRVGGGVTHLVEFLAHAQPAAHGISKVVLWAGRETADRVADRPWLEAGRDPCLNGSLALRSYWQSVKLTRLAARACDVLFVPGGSYGGAFRPFVAMSRSLLPFDAAERRRYGASWIFWKLCLLRWRQGRTFRRANGVIFLNESARSKIMESLGDLRGRWAVIPHGVGERFRRPPRPQQPLRAHSDGKPFRFLYVSIVDNYKHQWEVVEAMTRLRREGLPIGLDLVGSAYSPALRRLRGAMRRLDPQGSLVRYHGAVPYAELSEYYHRADGFVFASTCENMPNTLLEAMAAGLPIACAARPPMPSILGDAGIYFDPESPSSIAAALRGLLEDPVARERCAMSAYERARSYSWGRCAHETLRFIAEVARDAKRGSAH